MQKLNVTELIKTNDIQIFSGDKNSDSGVREMYNGHRSLYAINRRVIKERCEGDRWACAIVYAYNNEFGDVGYDVLNGSYETWHDPE